MASTSVLEQNISGGRAYMEVLMSEFLNNLKQKGQLVYDGKRLFSGCTNDPTSQSSQIQNIMTLEVGGKIFKMARHYFARFPQSRLGQLDNALSQDIEAQVKN